MVEFLIGGGAIVLLGVRWAARTRQRHRAQHRWHRLLSEVSAARAQSSGEHALKPTTSGSIPELRGRTLDVVVTTRITELGDGPNEARATSTAALEGEGRMVRFYCAWDHEASADFAHVPRILVPSGRFDGDMQVFAEDREFAERFVARAAIDLIDVRREACARGLELALRGGHLTLTVHGTLETQFVLERLQIVTARLCKLARQCLDEVGVGGRVGGTVGGGVKVEGEVAVDLEPHPTPAVGPPTDAICSLCRRPSPQKNALSDPDHLWVTCRACGAPYHARCHHQAAGCVRPGCDEVLTAPLTAERSSAVSSEMSSAVSSDEALDEGTATPR
ncbi:MAG: hypothetical protein IPK13_18240 [Deltaproteobacteria bacterium]|nr:hypothetical protein [Deltaproteobacteria bacterium]